MRILWVKMGGLWPATTGGRVRSLRTISELAKRHTVTVLTTHGPGDDPDGLKQQLARCENVTSLPFVPPKTGSPAFAAALARSWMSPDPVDLWKWRVPALREQVTHLMDSGEIDLCVTDFLFAAANVPTDTGVPVVLFEHNVEYLIWQRICAVEQSPWKRALLEIEWRKLRAREARACLHADMTIAVSDDDRRRLEEIAPGSRVTSVPTGVDTDYFNPAGYPVTPNRLVFSGSMDWHPNEDAVIYFVETILPRIRVSVPDVTFSIVGRNPSARVRDLTQHQGVIVTGTVEDVRPHIGAGSVYVVPLRAGSGTRLKIFEALAMARPVVSTTVGAEGLALEAGRQFVPADDPGEFADAVVALLRDPERRLALGDAGRTLVETYFSWPTIGREFERLCEEALAQHAYAPGLADSRTYLPRAGSPRPGGARVVAGEHGQIGWSHPHP